MGGNNGVRFWMSLSQDAKLLDTEVTEEGEGVLRIEGDGVLIELWHPEAVELIGRLRKLAENLELQNSGFKV